MNLATALFAVGARVPRRAVDGLARVLGPALSLLPLPGVAAWADTVTEALGQRPTRVQRAALLSAWLRNFMYSLSLARWSDEEILRTARISDEDAAKLRTSLAGPGLVLALPHMGSWDLAGAWCARVGIAVVSVAERLPGGLFERFREARANLGMTIYPVDEPDLMRLLADDVRAGKVVCLLSDRDLSGRGLRVPWPSSGSSIMVPAGPAILSRRTGADLRAVTCHFEKDAMRMEVSAPLTGATAAETMAAAVERFAAAVRRHPSDWLMLRRALS